MFPTTLREISNSGLIKMCVEYNGKRYFVGQADRYEVLEAQAEVYKDIKGVYVYATVKPDSTHIDGGHPELLRATANQNPNLTHS